MSKSNTTETDVLAANLKGTDPSWRSNSSRYIALHTADPGEAGSATNAAAVMASIIEAGYTLREVMALMAARDLGDCTGGPTAPAYTGLDGSTTRVTGTVDSNGNRSSITLTPG